MTDYLSILQERHACKIMDASKKISDTDFNLILEAGRLSPSSFGFEPWKFMIIQDEKLREKLLEFTWGAQNTLKTASHFVIILARTEKDLSPKSSYINYMMKDIHKLSEEMINLRSQRYQKFYEEDAKLLPSASSFAWACKQTYISLTNMINMAISLGIDSCPVEGFNQSLADSFISEHLKIDLQQFKVSVMSAFGYRVNLPNPKTRKPLNELVEWF